jgi:hypothetical protein
VFYSRTTVVITDRPMRKGRQEEEEEEEKKERNREK